MTPYLFLLAFFPVAYRLRGSGLIGNFKGYLAWSAVAGVAAFLFTMNPYLSAVSAFGAFAGKWIGHSEFYQVRTRVQFIAMAIIHAVRFSLVAVPIILELKIVAVAAVAAGISCAIANMVTCKLMDTKKIDDMLKYAEPVIGLNFAIFISLSELLCH